MLLGVKGGLQRRSGEGLPWGSPQEIKRRSSKNGVTESRVGPLEMQPMSWKGGVGAAALSLQHCPRTATRVRVEREKGGGGEEKGGSVLTDTVGESLTPETPQARAPLEFDFFTVPPRNATKRKIESYRMIRRDVLRVRKLITRNGNDVLVALSLLSHYLAR